MGYIASKNVHNRYLFTTAFIVATVLCLASPNVTSAQQSGTTVSSILCAPSSTITLGQPQSDSTVADSVVNVSGTINQTSQIEVNVDGQFDTVVPVSIGQTTYQTTVQLSPGTHTISLTAVDTCQFNNSSVSAVVTYAPQPQVPSVGTTIPTAVGEDGTSSGVVIEPAVDTGSEGIASGGQLLPQFVIDGYQAVTGWLNISTTDTSGNAPASLSVGKAFVIAIGSYLLAFGAAVQLVQAISATSLSRKIFGGKSPSSVRWSIRGFGLLLILIGLFT